MGSTLEEFNYRVRFARSRIAGAFIVLGGGATLALLLAIALPPLAKCALVAWVGVAMLDSYRTVAVRSGGRGVREMGLGRARAIEIVDAAGRIRCGEVRDGSFVAPWLTVIRWRPAGARFDRTIVVLPDMLGRDAFRRLRVLLRWF